MNTAAGIAATTAKRELLELNARSFIIALFVMDQLTTTAERLPAASYE